MARLSGAEKEERVVDFPVAKPVLTVGFPIRRGGASLQGRLLAASLRKFLVPDFRIIAFKDKHGVPLSRDTHAAFESLAVQICDIDTPLFYRFADRALLPVDALSAEFCQGPVLLMESWLIATSFINWHEIGVSPDQRSFYARSAFRKNIIDQSVLEDLAEKFMIHANVSASEGWENRLRLYNADAVFFDARNGFPDCWKSVTAWVLGSRIGGDKVRERAGQIALSLVDVAEIYSGRSLPVGWNETASSARMTSIVNYRHIGDALKNKILSDIIIKICEDLEEQGLDILGELSARDVRIMSK